MPSRSVTIEQRPNSSLLVDLHVYILPKNVWRNPQHLTDNLGMEQAISAGFVRVPESLTVHDLRRYILDTCSDEFDFPKEFVYLRSVGRCLTKVKIHQEKELKVKHFRPPATAAPEIYILEENPDERPTASSQSWLKPPASLNNSFVKSPVLSAKVSPRDLVKVREEQDRLEYRQNELARQRQQIEGEQRAATVIQNAFRTYRERQHLKQQEEDTLEIERLESEAKQLTEQQAAVEYAEERQVHDVVRLSNRLEHLRKKRLDLESNRLLIVRRIQQLQTQISQKRQEEKDLWKKKYFMEKRQSSETEEMLSKNSSAITNQLEQAKVRLTNSTKLRQQAEYESRLLRQELHQISSNLNALERYRLPKSDQN